ncbi:MAG: hypothetical protein MZW92_33520 [Comamonadaceae bacterium]|nr:hypothetical protein [Comamonadaceae bacterium]
MTLRIDTADRGRLLQARRHPAVRAAAVAGLLMDRPPTDSVSSGLPVAPGNATLPDFVTVAVRALVLYAWAEASAGHAKSICVEVEDTSFAVAGRRPRPFDRPDGRRLVLSRLHLRAPGVPDGR